MSHVKRRRPSLEEILQTLRGRLPDLRERYGVKTLGVFGSYVRGEQRRGSDVDVLVEFEDDDKPGLLGFIGLQQDLTDLLAVRVDLVEKKGLKPYIGRRVLEEVLDVSETESRPSRPSTARGGNLAASPQREIRDYLKDILDNVEHVEQLVQVTDLASLSGDWQKAYAVLHALFIIGEAARKIPTALRQHYAAVPWRSIVGLRNVVAHEYFGVNLPSIWQSIHEDLPPLRAAVARMLEDLEHQ